MLNETDEQQMYIQSLRNLTTLKSCYDRLGKVRYSLTEHEKVTLMTFPFGNGILCRSLTPKANAGKIRDKVVQAIKKKPSKKK